MKMSLFRKINPYTKLGIRECKKSNFHYTCGIRLKRVTSGHLHSQRLSAYGQHSYEMRRSVGDTVSDLTDHPRIETKNSRIDRDVVTGLPSLFFFKTKPDVEAEAGSGHILMEAEAEARKVCCFRFHICMN